MTQPAPATAPVNNGDIALTVAELRRRQVGIATYRNYYRGEQRPLYATQGWENSFGDLFRQLFDNVCGNVVDSARDRLVPVGFVGRTPDHATAADRAMEIWTRVRADQRFSEVHTEAGTTGDGYLLVGHDKTGQAVFYRQRAEQCYVHYSREFPGVIDWAAKVWLDDTGLVRLNLYYPDRIERYASDAGPQAAATGALALTGQNVPGVLPLTLGGFTPYQPGGTVDAGVDIDPDRAWVVKHPFGRVPMFHFPANASVGEDGVSDLHNAVPIQDALNKSLANLLVAGELMSFPQRWATGLETQYDADGREVEFKPGVERVWTVASELAKFGQFDPADIEKFIAEQNAYRSEVAAVTKTPLHFLGQHGQTPFSGEALRTVEAPFVAKIRARMAVWGAVWEDVFSYAIQVEDSLNDRGEFVGLAPAPQLTLQWADPETVSPLEKAQQVQLYAAAGFPLRWIATRVLALTEADADALVVEAEAAQQRAQEAATRVSTHGITALLDPLNPDA